VSWHRRFLAVAALAAGLTLAACAGGSATTGGPGAADAQRLTVLASDAFRFEPSSITARAGQPVELTLQNDGQISHDFTLTEGATGPVKAVAAGRQTATGTFTVEGPGTYRFVCSQPGHAEAGQVGVLTVE